MTPHCFLKCYPLTPGPQHLGQNYVNHSKHQGLSVAINPTESKAHPYVSIPVSIIHPLFNKLL